MFCVLPRVSSSQFLPFFAMSGMDKMVVSHLDPKADRFEFYKRVMKGVWPDKHIIVPTKPSKLKLGEMSKWDYKIPIRDHCYDVKEFVDKGLRLGHITSIVEFAVVLFDSVTIPQMRDWHRLHKFNYMDDGALVPELLLWELMVNFHDCHQERRALHKLQKLPPNPKLEVLTSEFNQLSVCVSADYLTDKGRCDLFITKLPDELVTRYDLVRRLEFDNWSLSRLQQEVSSSVTIKVPALGGHGAMSSNTPHVPFGGDLDAQGDTYMNALNAINDRLDLLAIGGDRSGGSGSSSKIKKKGPRCFRCDGFGHIAINCATPPPNVKN